MYGCDIPQGECSGKPVFLLQHDKFSIGLRKDNDMVTQTKRKKQFILCCMGFLVILYCSYGLLLQAHYSKDIYFGLANGDEVNWAGWLSLGRIVPVVIKQVLFSLGLAPTDPAIQTVIFFVLTWISMCILMAAFLRTAPAENLRDYVVLFSIVAVSVINPFYLEWFLFPECYFMFGVSILLSSCAVYAAGKTLTPKRWVLVLLFAVLAVNSYQACLGICFGYMLTLCLIRHKFVCNTPSLKELGAVLAANFIAAMSNMVAIKLLGSASASENGRGPSLTMETLLDNLRQILSVQGSFAKNAFGLLPAGIFTVFLLLFVLLFVYEVWQGRGIAAQGNRVFGVLQTIVVLMGGYASVFAVQAFSGNLWMSPRTIVGAFCSVACLLLVLYYQGRGTRGAQQILTGMVAVLAVFFVGTAQELSSDQLISNRMEQQEVRIVLNELDNYEKETGKTVTKVAFTSDAYITWGYAGVTGSYDINTRATAYSNYYGAMLEWLSGRRFEEVDYATVKSDAPQQENWDSFNVSEQVDFVDDTLCIIIY